MTYLNQDCASPISSTQQQGYLIVVLRSDSQEGDFDVSGRGERRFPSRLRGIKTPRQLRCFSVIAAISAGLSLHLQITDTEA